MLKLVTIALLALLTACKPAAPQASAVPPPGTQTETDTLTFFVSGLECAACTESVRQSIYGLDGIQKVLMREGLEGYATVTFATETVSAQQIAQAVYDAPPLHGTPYEASLKIRVPAYVKPDQAAKVDALIATQKSAITAEPDWEAKDQLIIRFLPLEAMPTPKTRTAQGWRHESLSETLHEPAPTGPALVCNWIIAE